MVYIVVYTSYYLPIQAQPLGLRHFFREAVGWIFSPMPPHRKYCSAKFNLARGVAAKNKGFLLSLFVEKLSSSEMGLNMPNTYPLPASFLHNSISGGTRVTLFTSQLLSALFCTTF